MFRVLCNRMIDVEFCDAASNDPLIQWIGVMMFIGIIIVVMRLFITWSDDGS